MNSLRGIIIVSSTFKEVEETLIWHKLNWNLLRLLQLSVKKVCVKQKEAYLDACVDHVRTLGAESLWICMVL